MNGRWVARRDFLAGSAAAVALRATRGWTQTENGNGMKPRIVSTWAFGKPANDEALRVLQQGGGLLDAVEQGIWVTEADTSNTSVGAGGIPNAKGVVQLDACIMLGQGHKAGSVAALEGFLHPISVARRVMEQTPHVMLVGEGAKQFALEQGFEQTDLLTPERRQAWEKWIADHEKSSRADNPQRPNSEPPINHDTIALLVVGADGNLAGGCSTSGWGYKKPGRVGDSPILGSGLYVDNEVGAAGATGVGENVMRYCASFMIVEAMRHGATPEEACVATIRRIAKLDPKPLDQLHINFVAVDRQGRFGAAGTDAEFQYSVTDGAESRVLPARLITD
jgi:N4-(beta-N-acetylglucosaminyl)-L-asparaginase